MGITPKDPADFDPTMGNYNDLRPFRFWCQKVLPLVYDDSLSYYEVLCKLVDYLNKTMEDVGVLHEDVDALHTAYQQLQSYVNDYFESLDVQEEINNKLDELVSDGTFDRLLLPYFNAYTTQINETVAQQNQTIAQQNNNITVLQQRMDNYERLPDGSTTGDAELIDIRTGANGVNYPTAGASVRGQITQLKNDRQIVAELRKNYFDKETAHDNYVYAGTVGGQVELHTDTDYWCGMFEVEPYRYYVLARADYDALELDENKNIIRKVSISWDHGRYYYQTSDSSVKYFAFSVYKYTTDHSPRLLPADYMVLDIDGNFDVYTKYPYVITLNDAVENTAISDIKLGANGKTYNTAGQAVRSQVSELNFNNQQLINDLYKNPAYNLFDYTKIREQTRIDGYGNIVDDNEYYITDYMPVTGGGILRSNNLMARAVFYDSGKNYISVTALDNTRQKNIPQAAAYAKIVFEYAVTPVSFDTWVVYWDSSRDPGNMNFYAPIAKCIDLDNILNDRFNAININVLENQVGEIIVQNYQYDVSEFSWEVGSIYGSNGGNYNDNHQAIRFEYPVKMFKGTIIQNNHGLNNRLFKYDSMWNFIEATPATSAPVTVPETGYYRVLYYSSAIPDITDPSELYEYLNIGGLNTTRTIDYTIDAAFNKQPKSMVQIGLIKGEQSFCIYNDKVYSTNGSFIAVQDLQTMTEEDRVSINVGHGNSFQLGHENIAYISGWNDNKLYLINLDTLELYSTLDLPTTGYTVCAVDDINDLVYIFQRDTQPATKAYYNVIVYDYIHSTIIRQFKTTRKWGSMQAVDFIDGRIFITWGDGSAALPNGFIIMNTSGDIIGEYILNSIKTFEPEGVFVDRADNSVIYLSYINANSELILCKLQ